MLQERSATLTGLICAGTAAVTAGVFVPGAQPLDWNSWRYILSIVGGLVAGAVTFSGIFPVAYITLRAVLNILSPEKWLLPILTGAHAAVCRFFAGFVTDFKATYRLVKDELDRLYTGFKSQYEAMAAQIRQILKAFGK